MISSLIVGGCILLFVFSYLMFKVVEKDNTHFLLQLLFLFFVVIMVFLVGKGVVDDSQNCDWLVVNQTVTGNTTSFSNSYICEENTNNTHNIFYKVTTWFSVITFTYIFLYFMYEVFKYLGWVVPKEKPEDRGRDRGED